jgi:hypothetical protein
MSRPSLSEQLDEYERTCEVADAMRQAAQEERNLSATTEWMEPLLVNIDVDAWYLVQTNGMEWRDHDLFVWRGIQVALKLKPEFVRGRPIRIARINLSEVKP